MNTDADLPANSGPNRRLVGVIALAGLAVALALLILFWPRPPADDSLKLVQARGTLVVAVDAAYPPFASVNDKGRFVGFDPDVAREIARRLGVKTQFVNVGVEGLLDALKLYKCDLVVSAFPYEYGLTRDVLFSEPYFNAGPRLAVRQDETTIRGPDDLAGRVVAVELGSGADGATRAWEARGIRLMRTMSMSDTIWALVQGQADAAVGDPVALRAYSRHPQGGGIQIVGNPIADEDYVVVLRIQERTLRDAVDEALLEMRQDGTLDELVDRWL
ncbi:MAG: ABC transporter substrate-binding protein [Chloroflexi bacterium]|nr:ABC transporter substrate-binding protein [Chloroflexota bacterium]MBU1749826.1 ABC transporter substrate-binding protein [Chloroflexota bacterium]MBU1879939.1 ABC transporter substrate-binding protein [Chloroflexota bacterium]